MSGFGEKVLAAWRDNRLISVLVELTYRCNLDCAFCYNDLGRQGRPLSTERWLRLFEELAELQVLNLVLSGGEPLAHPDFLRLGGEARRLGFVVRVKSNGHALRGELARRVRDEVDPFVIEVSLHGACAATHDRQTRVPGSFDRLLANLAELRALGLRVKINATLTRWNEDEVEAMDALAGSLGLPLTFDPEVTPRDDGDRGPLALAASREGVRRLFELQRRHATDGGAPLEVAQQGELVTPPPGGGKHCGAGSSGLTVDPFGNVYPCVQWRRPAGNLHDSTVREIWEGSSALREVRELAVVVSERLSASPQLALGGFCPGTAESVTGDPTGTYPALDLRRELLSDLAGASRPNTRLPVIP